MIKSYSFGSLSCDKGTFTKDLIILVENGRYVKIFDNWWRKEGHFLQEEDLEEVWKFRPEVLIIGTGAMGVMKVDKKVLERAKKEGILVEYKNTGEAVRLFNQFFKEGKKLAGAFHLTC